MEEELKGVTSLGMENAFFDPVPTLKPQASSLGSSLSPALALGLPVLPLLPVHMQVKHTSTD